MEIAPRVARVQTDFKSAALDLNTSLSALLPYHGQTRPDGAGPPVLYLLHGLSGDHTVWLRETRLESWAAASGMAVVMPQVHRSFYTDQAFGGRYWTFLTEELPALVQTWFHVSERREDTFVAGLSMGGYGAMKWALREPERFAAVAALSGTLDLAGGWMDTPRPEDPRMWERIFGGRPIAGGPDDLLWLLDRTPATDLPRLLVTCGTEDVLLPQSHTFLDACARRGVPASSDFGPGGHDWDYWNATIRTVLTWLR